MSVTGSNLITNGGFDTDTDWSLTGGVSIGGGVCGVTNVGSATQSISTTSGIEYQVVYTIKNYLGGTVQCFLGTSGGTARTGNGTYTESITADSTANINFQFTVAPNLEIDDVSVKEISVAATIEAAIFDVLRLNSTVNALVSERIYPQIVPQNTSVPAIVYIQVSGIRNHTLSGTDDMVYSRWQFTVIADTYAQLRNLSDAVRTALDNLDNTVGSVVVQCGHFIDESDGIDTTAGVDVLRRYTKIIEGYIWYNE